MSTEIELSVPGCSQFEPGVLLCRSVPEYHYCRSLLEDGYILGCRAAVGLDNAVSDLLEASPGSYDLSLRGRASVTVLQGSRGEGEIRGEARYRVRFAIPEHAAAVENCLRRDRYEYHSTGPNAGSAETSAADDCDDRSEGRFSAHQDDLRHAYDVCEGRRAWGGKTDSTMDLVVGGIFRFASATASSNVDSMQVTRSVTPYLAISAPLEVSCKD